MRNFPSVRQAVRLSAALLGIGTFSESIAEAASARLPANAKALAESQEIPFMTWAVVTDEGVRAGSYGVNETKLRQTDHVMFHVASVAKTVVAVGVMRLVSEGRLQLTDPVAELLPEVQATDERWRQVTVEHLLSHTSGLKDWDNNGYQTPVRDWANAFARLREPGVIAFTKDPGGDFDYVNKNFELLAFIIEKASAENFRDFLVNRVLAPYGAPNAQMSCYDAPEESVTPGYGVSVSGEIAENFYRPFSKASAGSGGLCITAKELALWGASILDCDREKPLLSCASLADMERVRKEPYGLGLFIDKLGEVRTIGHDGGDIGYTSALIMAPDREIVVAVTANFVFARAEDIAAMILADQLGVDYPENNQLLPLDQYAGYYRNTESSLCVRVSNDSGEVSVAYQDVDYPYAVAKFKMPPIPQAGIFQGAFPGGKLAHIYKKDEDLFVSLWTQFPTQRVERFKRTPRPETDCPGWMP